MINMLKEAIKNNDFTLNFQPILNLNSFSISSVESLIRWQHRIYGSISPSVFISLAEKNNLILAITSLVFEKVFSIVNDYPGISFAINVSGSDIINSKFISMIDDLIESYSVNPNSITLEITESIILYDTNITHYIFNELKGRGFIIHIDDFGTGYSSLSYLKKFPIDAIKIDRSFTELIHVNEREKSIIKSLINLGKAFEKKVVVEGVETKEQFDIIKDLGADAVQGYYFSHPLTISSLYRLLSNNNLTKG